MIIRPTDAEVRYFVASALPISDDALTVWDAKEFKKLMKATAYQTKITQTGPYPGILQVGILRWMSPQDAEAEMQRLTEEGVSWR